MIYLIDGSRGTDLQSNANVSWDLQIDLGSNRYVSNVVGTTDALNYADQYTLKSSSEGTNWTVVATEITGGRQQEIYSSTGFTARYLLMDVSAIVGGSSTWGYAVIEFEIWGK